MAERFDSMTTAMRASTPKMTEPDLRLKYVLEDGGVVAVYAQLFYNRSKPEIGGLRQIHLFRFSGDKVVEYWDVTQPIDDSMPNAAGAF